MAMFYNSQQRVSIIVLSLNSILSACVYGTLHMYTGIKLSMQVSTVHPESLQAITDIDTHIVH